MLKLKKHTLEEAAREVIDGNVPKGTKFVALLENEELEEMDFTALTAIESRILETSEVASADDLLKLATAFQLLYSTGYF